MQFWIIHIIIWYLKLNYSDFTTHFERFFIYFDDGWTILIVYDCFRFIICQWLRQQVEFALKIDAKHSQFTLGPFAPRSVYFVV